MVLITLNIPNELRELLKQESNQSALVTQILTNYYKTNNLTPEDANAKLKELEDKKKQMIEQIEKERESIVEIKEKAVEVEKTAQELAEIKEAKMNEKIINCMNNTREILGIELTEEQAKEFLEGDWDSINEYLDLPIEDEEM